MPAANLLVGQLVLVRPGDRIPSDGEIVEGSSGIDESPVTGECVPKTKGTGDPVFAGSINTEAALKVRVTKAQEDNTIARIIRLVEEAEATRAPTERFIARFSRWYMPAIVAMRCNPVLRVFAQRLRERGKTPMIIVGAVMRKLLHQAYGVLKHAQPFNPNHAHAG